MWIIDTYEVYRGCGHSYLHQVTDTSHSPYRGQVEEEIHSDHLSAKYAILTRNEKTKDKKKNLIIWCRISVEVL